jgi:hypothetical protein
LIVKCVGHHYTQTYTQKTNKISALLQTTGGKDEPNIVLCGNSKGHPTWERKENNHEIYQVYIDNF